MRFVSAYVWCIFRYSYAYSRAKDSMRFQFQRYSKVTCVGFRSCIFFVIRFQIFAKDFYIIYIIRVHNIYVCGIYMDRQERIWSNLVVL